MPHYRALFKERHLTGGQVVSAWLKLSAGNTDCTLPELWLWFLPLVLCLCSFFPHNIKKRRISELVSLLFALVCKSVPLCARVCPAMNSHTIPGIPCLWPCSSQARLPAHSGHVLDKQLRIWIDAWAVSPSGVWCVPRSLPPKWLWALNL